MTKTDAKKLVRAIERKFDIGNFTDYSEASKLLLGDIFSCIKIKLVLTILQTNNL